MHLIYGQPMHLVERPAREGRPLQKKSKLETALPFGWLGRSSVPTANGINGSSGNVQSAKPSGSSSMPSTSSAKADSASSLGRPDRPRAAPPLPRHSDAVQGVAGSSKRPPSPIVPPGSPKAKKAKSVGAAGFPVCGGMVHHLVKDCPEVKAGPKRCERFLSCSARI